MLCKQCGAENGNSSKFCDKCGALLHGEAPLNQNETSYLTGTDMRNIKYNNANNRAPVKNNIDFSKRNFSGSIEKPEKDKSEITRDIILGAVALLVVASAVVALVFFIKSKNDGENDNESERAGKKTATEAVTDDKTNSDNEIFVKPDLNGDMWLYDSNGNKFQLFIENSGIKYVVNSNGEKMPVRSDKNGMLFAVDKNGKEFELKSEESYEASVNSKPDGEPEPPKPITQADAIKALNDATAKVANTKAGYSWVRDCTITQSINVVADIPVLGPQDATKTLNDIIKAVAPESDLNSVVGGFIGEGHKDAKLEKGKTEAEGMDKADYFIKAMNLADGDVQGFNSKGNTFIFQLKNCSNPQKDGKNALNHATNDFLTEGETAQSIKDGLGGKDTIKLNSGDVQFYEITVKATVVEGNLTDLEISYKFDAVLNLSLSITGTGKAETTMKYSDFVY